ncbi:hypothetical protein GCM10020229_41910 [Kitasatospora albolonga]|uniref:aldehyde dehydrogenase family protein n=1 Tax=Kitasatospora albolonga TaxID=68173 RepID=UPI0031E74591
MALKTRNPIVFGFHPSAQGCSAEAARIVRDAAVAAGAPAHCVQWIEQPSMEATGALMNQPGVATILATGGNAMVKAAYSCGKPALGVGAGNVPAYIEKSADLKRAVNDVVVSKSFDNGMICASEQAVILDQEVYGPAMAEFRKLKAHVATEAEKALLESYVFGVGEDRNCAGAKLNAAVVGRSPAADRRGCGLRGAGGDLDHPGRGGLGRAAGAADPGEALPGAGGAEGGEPGAGAEAGHRDGGVPWAGALGRGAHRGRGLRRGVRTRRQGLPGDLERAQFAGRHRRRLQRLHALADAGCGSTGPTRSPGT